jgi:hypothetical protein
MNTSKKEVNKRPIGSGAQVTMSWRTGGHPDVRDGDGRRSCAPTDAAARRCRTSGRCGRLHPSIVVVPHSPARLHIDGVAANQLLPEVTRRTYRHALPLTLAGTGVPTVNRTSSRAEGRETRCGDPSASPVQHADESPNGRLGEARRGIHRNPVDCAARRPRRKGHPYTGAYGWLGPRPPPPCWRRGRRATCTGEEEEEGADEREEEKEVGGETDGLA